MTEHCEICGREVDAPIKLVRFREQTCGIVEGKLPKHGFNHVYGIRHGDDNDWATPLTVEKQVVINRWGYLLTLERLPLTYYDLTEEEQERFMGAVQ